jgi:hypothetical protein
MARHPRPDLGDVNVGVAYKFIDESENWPDAVAAAIKAPTGKDPYGIKLRQARQRQPAIPRTTDRQRRVVDHGHLAGQDLRPGRAVRQPVLHLQHAGLVQRHQPAGQQQGQRRRRSSATLADRRRYRLRPERADEHVVLGHRPVRQQKQDQTDGGDWQSISNSDYNAANFNVGLTFAATDNLTIVPNLAIGLTEDAPDFSFSLKFPYYF